MANENMTIRFTPDGFSYAECPNSASILLDDAPFHDVAPGPDFQQRLHEQLLDHLVDTDTVRDITCQFVSTRVMVLSPDMLDPGMATSLYELTLGHDDDEQVLLQPLSLPSGQDVTLCFGIDRQLYHFLMRNFGDVTFEHHLATLLISGTRLANGNCLVVRCDSQFLELALFRQKRLDVVNVYRTSQADNRCYYIMNTWMQQQLDQTEDNLLVLSQGNEGLQIRASLHRFIKHVYG